MNIIKKYKQKSNMMPSSLINRFRLSILPLGIVKKFEYKLSKTPLGIIKRFEKENSSMQLDIITKIWTKNIVRLDIT